LQALEKIEPALSGPDAARLLSAAVELGARMEKNGGAAARPLILSLRSAPQAGTPNWRCVAAAGVPANVAIVAVGAVPISATEMQVLVRIRNFSSETTAGRVRLSQAGAEKVFAEQPLQLPPNADLAVVHTVPYPMQHGLRIAWQRGDGAPDALTEDDVVVAAPRALAPPRIRLHAPLPALEKLYAGALNATLLTAQPAEKEIAQRVDLEIYAASIPEQAPANSGSMLFLAPERGYRSIFDTGKMLLRPQPQLDEKDNLNAGLADSPEGLFPVAEAREILQTGDYKSVLKDALTQRALVARFLDERGAAGFLMAFVPGAGLPVERPLDPALAAILVRIAMEAAGNREPLEIRRAEQLEAASGQALPLNWKADTQSGGAGVLDESVSNLQTGKPDGGPAALPLVALSQGRVYNLSPWLILLAMFFLALDLWFSRPARPGVAAITR